MPDIDPKLAASLGTINLNNVPNLHVTPLPTAGGGDPMAALQAAVTALQAANSALTSRVAELEKSNVAIRLVMQGIEPAFTTVKQQIADVHTELSKTYTEYVSHTHALPFDFESFDFIQDTPSNNKPNFLMAFVWEGAADKSLNQWQRQEEAQTLGKRTSAPVKKS